MENPRDDLDPATLFQFERIEKLEWVARKIVEGFLRGHHPSAHKGSSIEFAEHRAYVPGDEIRRIDWRTFARSDRHYVREYEDETNLRAFLLLDASRSMAFGSGGLSKMRYATSLAAALGFLLLRQRDAVGLITVDSRMRNFVPARATAENLSAVIDKMDRLDASVDPDRPSKQKKATGMETVPARTNLRQSLSEVAERVPRRSLILAFSDWLDDVEGILSGLSQLRHRGCEVVVFHVLDPAEVSLPFDGWTLFRDSENSDLEMRLDTRQMRSTYLEALEHHSTSLQKGCAAAEIDYIRLQSDEPFHIPLSSYLHSRSMRR